MDVNATSRIFKELLVAHLDYWRLYSTNRSAIDSLMQLTQKMMVEYKLQSDQVMSSLETQLPVECKEFFTFFSKAHLNATKNTEIKLVNDHKEEAKGQERKVQPVEPFATISMFARDDRVSTLQNKLLVETKGQFARNFHRRSNHLFHGFNWINVVAAGGYVVNALHNEKSTLSSDIDLWLLGDANTQSLKVQEIVRFFRQQCTLRHVTMYLAVSGSVLSLWIEDSKVMIQVICNTDHQSGADVISRFDFCYCQVYYDGQDVFGTALAVDALNSRITRVNPNKYVTQLRYQKALQKGFLVELTKDTQFEADKGTAKVLAPHYFPQSTVSNETNITALKARYRAKEVLVNVEPDNKNIVPAIKSWGNQFVYHKKTE